MEFARVYLRNGRATSPAFTLTCRLATLVSYIRAEASACRPRTPRGARAARLYRRRSGGIAWVCRAGHPLRCCSGTRFRRSRSRHAGTAGMRSPAGQATLQILWGKKPQALHRERRARAYARVPVLQVQTPLERRASGLRFKHTARCRARLKSGRKI
jgi:hypothetical protein